MPNDSDKRPVTMFAHITARFKTRPCSSGRKTSSEIYSQPTVEQSCIHMGTDTLGNVQKQRCVNRTYDGSTTDICSGLLIAVDQWIIEDNINKYHDTDGLEDIRFSSSNGEWKNSCLHSSSASSFRKMISSRLDTVSHNRFRCMYSYILLCKQFKIRISIRCLYFLRIYCLFLCLI